tara:strand:+ start:234 stop:377 length:144 start_codon:yes stop_codon:yes gene_type:complete
LETLDAEEVQVRRENIITHFFDGEKCVQKIFLPIVTKHTKIHPLEVV